MKTEQEIRDKIQCLIDLTPKKARGEDRATLPIEAVWNYGVEVLRWVVDNYPLNTSIYYCQFHKKVYAYKCDEDHCSLCKPDVNHCPLCIEELPSVR